MNDFKIASNNITKLNGFGMGKGFPLNTAFRYQTTPDLPLMEVPNELFITYSNISIVKVESGGQPVSGTMAGITVYVPRSVGYSEVVPEADVIRSEYALKAVPMKYTTQFLDFASERSKSKTGSTEGEGYSVGFSVDISKIFTKDSSGEVNGEYQKSFETAFSYYVDQGKKYLIDLAYIKLVETYRDKLIGLDYIYKGSKYKTDIDIAGSWIKLTNEQIDKRLDIHFEQLKAIANK